MDQELQRAGSARSSWWNSSSSRVDETHHGNMAYFQLISRRNEAKLLVLKCENHICEQKHYFCSLRYFHLPSAAAAIKIVSLRSFNSSTSSVMTALSWQSLLYSSLLALPASSICLSCVPKHRFHDKETIHLQYLVPHNPWMPIFLYRTSLRSTTFTTIELHNVTRYRYCNRQDIPKRTKDWFSMLNAQTSRGYHNDTKS